MASQVLRVEGEKELRRQLREIGNPENTKELRAAHRAAADVVVRRAVPKVPVRSGRLRQSVRALAGQRDAKVNAGSARVPHAGAVHFGRKRGNVGSPPGNHPGANPMQGTPFLFDARDEAMRTGEVESAYAAAMERLLDKIR